MRELRTPFILAGATIGFGQIGKSLNSSALQGAGEVTGAFISPAISIQMGGHIVKSLRDLKKELRKD